MKISTNIRNRKVKLVELNSLEKRIETIKKHKLNKHQKECFDAMMYNYEIGNYKKAESIAGMLETSLNNLEICKALYKTLKLIK